MQTQAIVAVTGMGLVTPAGMTVDDSWARCLRNETAIALSNRIDSGLAIPLAEVPSFDLAASMRFPKNEKFMTASVRFALRAALDAVASARLDLSTFDPYRIALYSGSGQTGLEPSEFFSNLEIAGGSDEASVFANMGGRASRALDRYWSLRTLSNAGVGLMSMELGAKGPSDNFVQDDTSSAMAILSGMRDLEDGRCDVAIVGGYDSLLTVSNYLTYAKAGLLDDTRAVDGYRPFDRTTRGLVLGEGAGFVVLERADDARRRGAAIATLLGAGCTVDIDDSPNSTPSDSAMRAAITTAVGDQKIDMVVARGIGTLDADRKEATILERIIGSDVPVTALKGTTGYLGAATAAVEFILGVKAARERSLPPIAQQLVPHEACRLSLVSGSSRRVNDRPTVLTLSQSWFGRCAALAAQP